MFRSVDPRITTFTHNALRVVAGFLYSLHGAQKLFGVLGREESAELFSLMGAAGVIEFFGGLLLMFGLFTRPVAFICSGQMAVAYFMAHVPQGFWPIMNGGELAAFYCFTWLFFFAHGPGDCSLDARLGREGVDGG